MKLAVVIPNFNGIEHLRYSVPAALKAAGDHSPIVLVDDRSTDASLEFVRSLKSNIQIRKNLRAQGFAGSVNTGLIWAINEHRAEFIAIANSDIVLHPNSINQIRDFLASHHAFANEIGILGIREINPPNIAEDLDRLMPKGTFLGKVEEAKSVPGCFFVVSSFCLSAVGGLDESYFMYGEDNDFFFRVRANGFKILSSELPVWHRGEGSSRGSIKTSWLAYRNAVLFAIKNESPVGAIRTVLSLLNQAVNPLLSDRCDPSYLRLSRHNILVNLSLLLGSLVWNLVNFTKNRRGGPTVIPPTTNFGVKRD